MSCLSDILHCMEGQLVQRTDQVLTHSLTEVGGYMHLSVLNTLPSIFANA